MEERYTIMLQKIKTTALILLLGILWGSAFSIARYAVTHGVAPLGYAFWQVLGPTFLLTLYRLKKRWHFSFSYKYAGYCLILGLFGILLPNTNKYILAAHTPSGTLAIVTSTMPLFVYPIALLVKEERFCITRLFGVTIGTLGILCIVLSKAVTININYWTALACLTPFCYALGTVYAVKKRPHDNSIILAHGMLIASTLLLLPLVLTTHQFYPLHYTHNPTTLAILLEILLSTLGYILLFELLKTAGSVCYSLTDGVVAITGLILGRLCFHETIHANTLLAVLCILLGIGLISQQFSVNK
jgi:drug/metabolite transporter (DMT)-like permease